MKPDEKKFAKAILTATIYNHQGMEFAKTFYVGELIKTIGLNEKRAAYILLKWSDKGWYDYGVAVFAGWLTEKGMDELKKEMKK